MLNVGQMETIKKDLSQQIEEYFNNNVENDEQAKLCLDMGIAIYYTQEGLEERCMIKEYSNGVKQLIRWNSIDKYEVINDNYK